MIARVVYPVFRALLQFEARVKGEGVFGFRLWLMRQKRKTPVKKHRGNLRDLYR